MRCEDKKYIAKQRSPRERVPWDQFRDSLSSRQFRRMFRMEKSCFEELCNVIIDEVGEKEFKSQLYINTVLNVPQEQVATPRLKRMRSMYHAQRATSGGYICGEVKVAITLRLLSGGSYLDLAALYNVGYSHIYEIFHHCISEWICRDEVIKFPGIDYLDDFNAMQRTADLFRNSGCHGGILNGCIGALDGWIVKIRCPRESDGVGGTDEFYCRKGFYGINVQAIVDKNKLIIWRAIQCRGSEHDSKAFKKSDMYKKLQEVAGNLLAKGFYFMGDSAYSIRSYLLVPFDNAGIQSAQDAFNYHLSTCRIWVECAFGEIDMRWGILWKHLPFSLHRNVKVIDATMRLHNFIVAYRMKNHVDLSTSEVRDYQDDNENFLRNNHGEIVGVVTGNDGTQIGEWGRLPRDEEDSKREGKQLRQLLSDNLRRNNCRRPAMSSGATWYRDRFNRTMVTS